MPPGLILVIIEALPGLFSAAKQLSSLTGNTQARVDTVIALIINAIPDSLAPTWIPEIKSLVQEAVGIYDKIAPMLAGLTSTVTTVTTVAAAAAPAAAAPAIAAVTGLGQAMPA